MRHSLALEAAASSYPVIVDPLAYQTDLRAITAGRSRVFLLSSAEILQTASFSELMPFLPAGTLTIIVPDGEDCKNLETATAVWEQLIAGNADRGSLIINFGGGAISDLGGFVAATFQRGMAFVNLPTTKLAMVDAAIGGKTGINFAAFKNYIGAFAQPVAVLINPSVLKTLSKEQFDSGMAETIKHAAIADAGLFAELAAERVTAGNSGLTALISQSAKIKINIVQQDQFESGARKLLNFGHTAGHAFESLALNSDEPLLHGQAIACGMYFEALLAEAFYELKPGTLSKQLKELLESYDLPIYLQTGVLWEQFSEKIKKDKKNQNSRINWTLVKQIGMAEIDVQVPEALVRSVYKDYCSEADEQQR